MSTGCTQPAVRMPGEGRKLKYSRASARGRRRAGRRPRGGNGDPIDRLPAADDPDGEVLVADIDDLDVSIDTLSLAVDGVDFFFGDVGGRGRFRLRPLGQRYSGTQSDGDGGRPKYHAGNGVTSLVRCTARDSLDYRYRRS